MVNVVVLQGRLTRDPELRYTPSETATVSFGLAVDRDFKNKNGDKETDFLEIVCWRATAEFVSKYFKKGDMVTVNGRIQVRKYTDRDGNKRTATEIVAENVYFCGGKTENKAEAKPATAPVNVQYSDMEDAGDGLPF